MARATLADFEGSYAKPQSHVSQVQRQLQQAAENGNSSATKLQQVRLHWRPDSWHLL